MVQLATQTAQPILEVKFLLVALRIIAWLDHLKELVWKLSSGVTAFQGVKVKNIIRFSVFLPRIIQVNVMLTNICLMLFFLEIRCREPVLAEHAILSVTGNDRLYGRTLIRTADSATSVATYKIGALVKYRCERGYKIEGDPLSTCEDNGKWSGQTPQCICKLMVALLIINNNKAKRN